MGGSPGRAAVAAGATANWGVVLEKVVLPMFISPVVAFSLGFALMVVASLAAGNGVVFKPAPETRRCAELVARYLDAVHGYVRRYSPVRPSPPIPPAPARPPAS